MDSGLAERYRFDHALKLAMEDANAVRCPIKVPTTNTKSELS